MRKRDALPEGSVENSLPLFDIHLDADGFETHPMNCSFRHDYLEAFEGQTILDARALAGV